MVRGITLLFLFFISVNAEARIQISNISFDTEKNNGKLNVHYSGELDEYPDLKVLDNKVVVYIPDSAIKSEISKKIAFASSSDDTEIRLQNGGKSTAQISVNLPFDVQKHEHKVSVLINDNSIVVSLPKLPVEKKYLQAVPAAPKVETKTTTKSVALQNAAKSVDKEILNESFLKDLEADMKEKTTDPLATVAAKTGGKKVTFSDMRQSKSSNKSKFSLMEYGAKFAAFLAVVLLLFYGLVTLFKKGFIKKGKLGFLHKTEQVQVISQTYIAPKKSLMLIKAYNQVFLVSNTDAGITLVSEIADSTGLIKETEREAAGSNFDDNVSIAEADDAVQARVKLKEDIAQSNSRASLSDYMNVRDKVKFSDQIKNKVKNLKPLQ